MKILRGREIAEAYLEAGVNPVPLDGKVPLRENWVSRLSKEELETYDFDEIGICTGIVSGGIEAIDFDLKYTDKGEELMKQYQKSVGGELLRRLVIQSTANGGYHLLYRCEQLEGNKVLARNSKGEVLIETRGDGGYVKCYPSAGYDLKQGDITNIPLITPLERNILLAAAFRLDQEVQVKGKKTLKQSKFPRYDSDPEIGLGLLKSHGWVEIERNRSWVELRRPNKSFGMSGGYCLEGNFLYVFTTSTEFKERTPYSNVAIFAMLECDNDFKRAYSKLQEMGYSERTSSKNDGPETEDQFRQSLLSLSFLSTKEEEYNYLKQAADGLIPQGLSTGWPTLDEHLLLKENTFNVGLGLDGVGKSVFMNSLQAASNVLHGWKWGIVAPENKTAMTRRRLMEAHSGRSIDFMGRNPRVFERWMRHANENYYIVGNKKHWSIPQVLEMGKRLFEVYGIKAFLIDPYNFFKVDSKNGYSWNNEILSQLRVFAEEYCSVYLMAHPHSETPRKLKDADGYVQAPSAYDIQGGADFPYRVDDFFVTHRIKNHESPEVWKTMQIIVHKIKETETGGKPHPRGKYTALKWDTVEDFTGYFDVNGHNPMKENLPEFMRELPKTSGGYGTLL